ncbi:BnaA04g28880D [Brassica napus]|uniref:BnaA04g28880D protein n=1 Tax=Brassica napus TaxID=3708 RepID=A0A078J7E3_BRANA|nr:BnaA04g28880D [Brassica napus]
MQPPRQNVSKGGELTNYRGVTRSMTRRHRNSLPVPDELAMEIFSRLPSKAMAMCRCACKLWSSMLRRQDFTELFLTKSCARPQLLFFREDHSVREFVFISSPQPENPQENSYVVASNPLACFPRSSGFYGCTNGFFCYGADRFFKRLKFPVCVPVICNPSTGQSLTMPRLISKKRYGVQSYLGYEPIEKELKLLSMNNSLNGPIMYTYYHLQTMCIAGMVGTNEIVFSPIYQRVPYYVIYFNVERRTITKVGIQGLEAFQGKSFKTYLNYVENVKLL